MQALCSLDGEEAPCESGVQFQDLLEGPHKFEVWALDETGNRGDPDSYQWTIDLTAPTVIFTAVVLDFGKRGYPYCSVDGKTWDCTRPITDGLPHKYSASVGSTDSTVFTWNLGSGLRQVSFSAGPQPAGSEALILVFQTSGEAVSCTVDGRSFSCDQRITHVERAAKDTIASGAIKITATDAVGNQSDPIVFTWTFSWTTIVG